MRRLSVEDALGRYVSIRPRSEFEVRQYLKQRAHKYSLTPEDIERFVERYKEVGFINDAQFAESMTHSVVANKAKGERFLRMKLKAAGVDPELITTAVGSVSQEDIRAAMEKRLAKYERKWAQLPKRERFAKAYTALLAAGFSSREIGPFIDDWLQKE
jgi:regulatory protein